MAFALEIICQKRLNYKTKIMGRLEQIKAKWDKKKNEILTIEEIKNKVAAKQEKYEKKFNKNR
jgi:hypothetical protein